jgi:tetratricopeptide (TPR) repeat protein
LVAQRRPAEAMDQYEQAIRVNPKSLVALSNFAWELANCNDVSLRNPARALELAKQADRLTGGTDPSVLRILASARARAGQYPEAAAAARRAMELARERNDTALQQVLEEEIAGYRFKKALNQ